MVLAAVALVLYFAYKAALTGQGLRTCCIGALGMTGLELVSNAFTQTAETREFATGMRLAPDGSFVISKGGQQSSTIGRHNGKVVQEDLELKAPTGHAWRLPEVARGPLMLQADHGPVAFRNIRVRPLD